MAERVAGRVEQTPYHSRGQAGVGIVVVNFNGGGHLPALFEHLAAQTVRDFTLVLVDNGSTDGSAEQAEDAARRHTLPIEIIRNRHNTGFSPACNLGSRHTTASRLVMLNNDTRPEPAWLEELLNGLDEARRGGDTSVAMIASKMLRAQRPEQIDSAGIALDWAGIAWDWLGGVTDKPGATEPVEVFGPCGGAALYDRAVFAALGGFDDDFFAYMEDVDLAWRARLAGYRCLLAPQARILHAHSATLGDASPLKRFLLARNKVWTLVKNYPNPWFVRLAPIILAYDGLAAGYGVLRRRDFPSLRGRVVGLAQSRAAWRKRREIQRRWRDVDNWRRMVAPLDLPWHVPRRYAHLVDGVS